jgi:hypothetical protein
MHAMHDAYYSNKMLVRVYQKKRVLSERDQERLSVGEVTGCLQFSGHEKPHCRLCCIELGCCSRPQVKIVGGTTQRPYQGSRDIRQAKQPARNPAQNTDGKGGGRKEDFVMLQTWYLNAPQLCRLFQLRLSLSVV